MNPIHAERRKELDREADALTDTLAELQERAQGVQPTDPIHREIKTAWERLADVQRELIALDREERRTRA
jgi:hypothetical protein